MVLNLFWFLDQWNSNVLFGEKYHIYIIYYSKNNNVET
jgi:hypothetical protein